MKMNPMGRTGLMVSELCLGTMTFGTQTSAAQGQGTNGLCPGQWCQFCGYR